MAKYLYINNELVDLSADTVIALTFQVNDISDIETRNGNYSNEFELPRTANNNRILGYGDLNTNSLQPYRRNIATYIQDGIEIISNGFAVIDEVSDTYKVTIYSSNTSFYDILGEDSLRDIDLSAYDHDWSNEYIRESLDHTYSDVYAYPIVDYGNMAATGNSINTHYLFPAIFARHIFEKIISDAGYALDTDLLTDDRFNNLLLLWSSDKWEHSEEQMDFYRTETNNTGQIGVYINAGTPYPINPTTYQLQLGSAKYISEASDWFYCPNYFYDCKFKIDITIRTYNNTRVISGAFPKIYNIISIKEDGLGKVSSGTIIGAYPDNPETYTISTELVCNVKKYSYYTFFLSFHSEKFSFDFEIENININIDYDYKIKDNARFKLADQLPDISKRDFIKAIFELFAITPSVDDANKILSLYRFEKFKENKSLSKDWSDKISDNFDTIIYRSENYYQKNKFIYEKDNYIPASFGDGFFEIDDEILSPQGDILESIFGSSQQVTRLSNDISYIEVPYINKIDDDGNPTESSTLRIAILETVECPFELDLITNYGDTTPYTFTILEGRQLPLCYFYKQDGLYNLDWQTLLDEYYPTFVEKFDKLKVIRAEFNLNSLDVYRFDHFIPVYISKYNSYFYVNTISNYKEGFLTEVELVKTNI